MKSTHSFKLIIDKEKGEHTMKKLVCELCGESDFLKTDGMFECQSCGAKYSLEEARSMFIDVDDSNSTRSKAPANDIAYEDSPDKKTVKRVVVAPRPGQGQTVKRVVPTPTRRVVATPQPGKKVVVQKPTDGKTPVVKKVVVKPQVRTTHEVEVEEPQVKTVDVNKGMGIGSAQMIENLFILSQNAFDSENYVDAENYANRVIELDASNSDAWLMKGNCAGKNTDGTSIRLLESINCWNTCLVNSEKSDYEDYQFTVRTNCIDIAVAYVIKNCKKFMTTPNNENFDLIKEKIDELEPIIRKANQTFGVDVISYEDKLASNISAIVTAISKQSIKDYGKKKEQQTEEKYKQFVAIQDACIYAWEYLLKLAKRHGTVTAILSNIKKMNEAIIRNCGYKVTGGGKIKVAVECSMAEKNKRLEAIKRDRKIVEDMFVDIRKRDRVEQKFKNEKYWAEHAEEKAALLEEHTKLDHEVFELENSKLKMPELTELKKLEEEALRLQILKDNPTYSNKERTAYMNQLTKVKKQVVTKKRELASRLNPIEQQIEKYKKRMFTIETELNMNR